MENEVAATARTTASIRARESARLDGLFRDPLAEVLAGHEAMTALHAMPEAVQDRSSMSRVAAAPACHRRTVAVDFTNAHWPAVLKPAGLRSELPTAWLAEGVLPYLAPEVAIGMLDAVSELSPRGSHFAADVVDEASIVIRNQYLAALRALSPSLKGAPFQFGTNDAGQLLADHGWATSRIMEPGDEGANFGRFIAPPGRPNLPLPRLSFVLALRA